MLRLKARLNFCGKELTEDYMIQKTLEYDNKRITTFNKLINLLQVAERHDEVLLSNNARPIGTKKIPETNYGKVKDGKNPNAKGVRLANPYPRGNNAPHGKGHGGRDIGRGGPPNIWRRDGGVGPSGNGNKVQRAPKNPSVKPDRVGNEPCYRCGIIGHWYKNCQASNTVAATYKRYRESKEQEAHYMEEGGHDPDVNLTITDFNGNKELAQSIDA
ncbi:uncharacterized protein LOC133728446 [Rosa rugosa]|uniref:uncharacterized protein LOC133728446 n=1 Tax=Rosa rugosa TaxID=74645 RepID=UPI002B403907|nr:uncharacterized protein LOC133728446 [Rosa rugosa]